MENALLVILGAAIGAFGTLIGAGGGFLLVPTLLLLYPAYSPRTVTSMSLMVVFFNALSGSLAYARMRRIEYRSGLFFSAATIPGAILGAVTVTWIPRRPFDGSFGVLLIALAVFLIFKSEVGEDASCPPGRRECTVVERDGTMHRFSYDLKLGVILSVVVGYVSSLLGIGGGIIHVPVLVRFLHFPVHIATATSHFVLAVMAFAGTLTHVATGSFHQGIGRALLLSAGVLLGAQAGARLSTRIHGVWIIRGLACALAAVGLRLVATVIR